MEFLIFFIGFFAGIVTGVGALFALAMRWNNGKRGDAE